MTASGDISPPYSAPRRILVVFNPTSGRRRRLRFEQVIAAVRALGCAVTIAETTAPGHAEVIVREAAPGRDPSGFDVVAAAGGDGTINEIVNGLGAKDMILGIIPLGTANVLAHEIGLGDTSDQIARALAYGPVGTIRVGLANGRRFIMMAGVGFDANVVDRVSVSLKSRIGRLAYFWQAARVAMTDRHSSCDLTIDGALHRALSVIICNGRHYGGPFIAAPGASLAADQFHVLLMQGRGLASIVRYGVGLMAGKLTSCRGVQLVEGREISVSGEAGQPVQVDGDIVSRLPVHITIDSAPLRLLYPA